MPDHTYCYANSITLVMASGGTLVHQANTIPVAGDGIALAIANQFPSWRKMYLSNGRDWLGKCWMFTTSESPNVRIASLYAQSTINRGKRNTNYEALATALEQLALLNERNKDRLYIPHLLGCRLAGGAWPIVSAMITHYLFNHEVTIVRYDA